MNGRDDTPFIEGEGDGRRLRNGDSGIMSVRCGSWTTASGSDNELQGHYIRAIRSYRLLSLEEEQAYARQFDEGRRSMRSMIERFPQAIAEELKRLSLESKKQRLAGYIEVEFSSSSPSAEWNGERQAYRVLELLLGQPERLMQLLKEFSGLRSAPPADGGTDANTKHVVELGEFLKKMLPEVEKLNFRQRFYTSCVELFLTDKWPLDGLKADEYSRLCKEMQHASDVTIEAMNRLVESNLRLVISIARRYVCSLMSLSDLVQEGNIGLMRAVEAFEYNRGHRFSTYASYWIRQAISNALNSNGRSIRMPVNILRQLSKIRSFERVYLQENGALPTEEQVAEKCDLSVARIRALQRMGQQPISLQAIGNDDRDCSDILADEGAVRREHEKSMDALRLSLSQAMDTLDDREREILIRRFGLNGCEVETLDQLASRFALTGERIRQLEAIALRKLRKPESQQFLDDWR